MTFPDRVSFDEMSSMIKEARLAGIRVEGNMSRRFCMREVEVVYFQLLTDSRIIWERSPQWSVYHR